MNSSPKSEKSVTDLVERWIKGYRRGSLRFFILHLLLHQSRHSYDSNSEKHHSKCFHGYNLALTIDKLTEGKWRPTTASIYPILKELNKYGVIEEIEEENLNESKSSSKNYRLTDYGAEVAKRLELARMDFVRPLVDSRSRSSLFPLLKLSVDKMHDELEKQLNDSDTETLTHYMDHIKHHSEQLQILQHRINNHLEKRKKN